MHGITMATRGYIVRRMCSRFILPMQLQISDINKVDISIIDKHNVNLNLDIIDTNVNVKLSDKNINIKNMDTNNINIK